MMFDCPHGQIRSRVVPEVRVGVRKARVVCRRDFTKDHDVIDALCCCSFETVDSINKNSLTDGVLMSEPKPILVTAGIIIRDDEVLVCQRHRSDPYGLQWEFPGGKVKDGEDLKASLRRELREELGIEAVIGNEAHRLRHRYPDRYVEVIFFEVESYQGEIGNQVFESIEWAPRKQLARYNFLEADRDLVHRLAEGDLI